MEVVEEFYFGDRFDREQEPRLLLAVPSENPKTLATAIDPHIRQAEKTQVLQASILSLSTEELKNLINFYNTAIKSSQPVNFTLEEKVLEGFCKAVQQPFGKILQDHYSQQNRTAIMNYVRDVSIPFMTRLNVMAKIVAVLLQSADIEVLLRNERAGDWWCLMPNWLAKLRLAQGLGIPGIVVHTENLRAAEAAGPQVAPVVQQAQKAAPQSLLQTARSLYSSADPRIKTFGWVLLGGATLVGAGYLAWNYFSDPEPSTGE